jgi:hypothetical protein
VRRLKRLKRNLRVGVFMPVAASMPNVSPVSADDLNADFVAVTIVDAVKNGFADEKPVLLRASPKRLSPRRAKSTKRAPAAA